MGKQETKGATLRIAVFGLGRFGFDLAVRLAELGADVLAVDSEPELVEQVDQRVSRAICLDATNEFAVRKISPGDVDLAVGSIGRNIEAGLLVTAVLQRLGVKDTWVRAIAQNQPQILEAMGITPIFSLEREMLRHPAQQTPLPGAQVFAPPPPHHPLPGAQPARTSSRNTL